MANQGKLIFISGGVRSGKSQFAEQLAGNRRSRSETLTLHYIATGVAMDSEMTERIHRHQRQRSQGIDQWQTWEQPRNLALLSTCFNNQDMMLLDCLTNLVNNELFADFSRVQEGEYQREVMLNIQMGIGKLRERGHTLIVVSNEIFHEVVPAGESVLLYVKLLGKLHQWLVQEADEAYLVEAGVPICKKGGVACIL